MEKNRLLVLMSSMFLMVMLCASCEEEQGFLSETYYWDGNEKVAINPIENKFYIAYQTSNENKLIAELSKNGLSLTNVKKGNILSSFDSPSEDAQLLLSDYKSGTLESDYRKLESIRPYTICCIPCYTLLNNGRELIPDILFFAKLKSGSNLEEVEKLAKKYNVIIVGIDDFINCYELVCTNDSKGTPIEIANKFYESGLFEYAVPNFSGLGELTNF